MSHDRTVSSRATMLASRAAACQGWVGPGDSLEVGVPPSDSKARLYKRLAGYQTTLATSATSLSLTTNNWYTMKVVVGDDLGNSALQRLRFWVDTDDDGDWSDETALLDSTAVDDEWSAGHVGVPALDTPPAAEPRSRRAIGPQSGRRRVKGSGSVTNSQEFDDFAVGLDNNADLDIADGGDDVLVADDFNSNVVTPVYNNNGQVTFDGVWTYTYDAWRRPRKAQLVASGDTTTIQEVAWLGDGRLASRTITNSGVENTPNDGGNTVVHPYFTSSLSLSVSSSLAEERNGSNQVVRAYLWDSGTGYQPVGPVWMETNGDPTIGNDTNPDVAATGEGSESPADGRYFYHSDANGMVVALTEYDGGAGSVNGRIVERYTRNPHGAALVLAGDSGSGEMSAAGVTSIIGNPFNSGGGGSGPLFISTGGGGIGHDEDAFGDGGGITPIPWTPPVSGGGGTNGECPTGQVYWAGIGCIPESVLPNMGEPCPFGFYYDPTSDTCRPLPGFPPKRPYDYRNPDGCCTTQYDSMGWIECCHGKVTVCIGSNGRTLAPELKECLIEHHEKVHTAQYPQDYCKDKPEGHWIGTDETRGTVNANECYALEEELRCVVGVDCAAEYPRDGRRRADCEERKTERRAYICQALRARRCDVDCLDLLENGRWRGRE